MFTRNFLSAAFGALALHAAIAVAGDKSEFVNVFTGTDYTGHTFPGACFPFGLIQASPDTGAAAWKYCSGYNNSDTSIHRFSQTHLNGTGVADLGDAAIMPFDGDSKTPDYRSSFDKATEKASPGFYGVYLKDAKADVKVTASEYAAFYRIKYDGPRPRLLLDTQHGVYAAENRTMYPTISSEVNFESPTLVTGSRKSHFWIFREVFFAMEFSCPIKSQTLLPPLLAGENGQRYALEFDLPEDKTLEVRISVSLTGVEGAKKNLESASRDTDFDKALSSARAAWNGIFDTVEIGGSAEQKANFYTALYHACIQPNNVADCDGTYRTPKGEIKSAPNGKYYSTLSNWDVFRAAYPLYTLLAPDLAADVAESMLMYAESAGALPVWGLWGGDTNCMIGSHGISLLAEVLAKGMPLDAGRALNAALASSQSKNLPVYEKMGYFPFDVERRGSVAKTLEWSYDDWCVAKIAEAAGDMKTRDRYMKRSQSYKNIFDPASGYMRGKDSKGAWRDPFDEFKTPAGGGAGLDYVEGNAIQYTWHVLHDPEGLISLFGGNEKFVCALSKVFEMPETKEGMGFSADSTGLIGQYAHGNEPSHHIIYLFALADRPDRTAELVREVFDRFYKPTPEGLCGNDDCGQMSAWYAFGALGFYPLNPASAEYVLGAPQIPSATISLPNGKKFEIAAENLSEENKYVKRIVFNGSEYSKKTISHSDILKGGTLVFEMASAKGR